MGRLIENPIFRQAVAVLAWSALAFIAFATLSPIEHRPGIAGIKYEHIMAFAVAGFLFGMAYPRKWPWLLILLPGAAIVLEVLQHFVPGRHGRLVDVAFKLAGAFAGLAIAWLAARKQPAPAQPNPFEAAKGP